MRSWLMPRPRTQLTYMSAARGASSMSVQQLPVGLRAGLAHEDADVHPVEGVGGGLEADAELRRGEDVGAAGHQLQMGGRERLQPLAARARPGRAARARG